MHVSDSEMNASQDPDFKKAGHAKHLYLEGAKLWDNVAKDDLHTITI